MSAFKIKHDKTKHMIQINTLDETHKKFMKTFQNRRSLLPKKKKRLEFVQNQLEKLENVDASKFATSDIKKRSEFKTEIQTLEEEIYDIENDLSELDYYFKTEDIIMDYYQITEIDDHTLYSDHPELCEEQINKNTNNPNPDDETQVDKLDLLNQMNKNKKRQKKVTKRRKKRLVSTNQVNILDFLNGNNNEPTSLPQQDSQQDQSVTEDTFTEIGDTEIDESELIDFDDNDKMVNTEQPTPIKEIPIKNKAELLDQYMMQIDSEYMCDKKRSGNKIKKCANCNVEKTLIHADGMYVCQKCGEIEIVIIDSEKPNYKEAVTDTKPGYPYKRINFLKWFIAAGYHELAVWSHGKIVKILWTN